MQNRQVLSHADIGFIENHRIDPGPLFPIWEQMAKLGVGLYPLSKPTGARETLFKLNDCNA